eukprot:UN00641
MWDDPHYKHKRTMNMYTFTLFNMMVVLKLRTTIVLFSLKQYKVLFIIICYVLVEYTFISWTVQI